MTRLFKRVSQKAGLQPGSLVFVGEQRQDNTVITIIDYDRTEFREKRVESVEECLSYRQTDTVTWIDVCGLHETEVVEKLATAFGIHPLSAEDILNTGHRPKLEDTATYILVLLKMMYPGEDGEIQSEQISIACGHNFVLSFQEREGDVFSAIRRRIKETVPRVRFLRPEYLTYALLDAIVDGYFLVLEQLADQVEACEDRIVEDGGSTEIETIHELRSEAVLLRRRIWPLREVVTGLERSESPLFDDSIRPYWRDLFDHTRQIIDAVESFREMVNGLMELNMSAMSNRMNQVMKVLTIIATIFIPLGFLAGVYGMNFDSEAGPFNMPELSFRYGYPLFWLLVVLIGGGLLWFFRRKRWL